MTAPVPPPTPGRFTRRSFVRLTLGGSIGLTLACTAPQSTPTPGLAKPAPTTSLAPTAAVAKRPLDVVKRGNLRGVAFGAAIAKARGYFEEMGIQDEEILFQAGLQMTQAMAAGEIEVAVSSTTAAFFNAIAQGARQPFVFDSQRYERGDTSSMIVLRPDLVDSIRRIADLRGRKNAASTPFKDGGSYFVAHKMFQANGLELEDAEWVQLPFPDMLPALANKSIDAAWIIEPFITLGQQRDLLVPWLALGDFDPGYQSGGIVYSERFIKERTDVARRWGLANVRGLRDYNDFLKGKTRDAIAPILLAHTGLAPELLDKVGWARTDPDGRLNVDSIMEAQALLREWGKISQVVPAEQIVDRQFAEYALQQLGPYRG